jgi:hypothetical protein
MKGQLSSQGLLESAQPPFVKIRETGNTGQQRR